MNWIVMPFVDCWEMTSQAVEDCLAQTVLDVRPDRYPSRLLLIDNGSQHDYGAQYLSNADPRIFFWRHQPPLPSLSATWNRALEFVWAAGGTHALVVNNDIRLAPWTYELLAAVQATTQAWFVSAVSVQHQDQLDLYLRQGPEQAITSLGEITESRKDGRRPEGYSYGGPDFSCFLITRECHRWFQFDEGFVPAYHEDNDYHRRVQLAGFGDKIFGVNLPFLHYGSATVNRSVEAREAWPAKFKASQDYYVRKWGGLPGQETYTTPFNAVTAVEEALDQPDLRTFQLGQGTKPEPRLARELFR